MDDFYLTISFVVPRIPEVRAVKENALIEVSWEKAETISGYFIQVFCDGEEIESSTTKDPKFIFRNPEPSKEYYFRVCAQNRLHSYGEFTQSNVIKTSEFFYFISSLPIST